MKVSQIPRAFHQCKDRSEGLFCNRRHGSVHAPGDVVNRKNAIKERDERAFGAMPPFDGCKGRRVFTSYSRRTPHHSTPPPP
jgi:hypothetical protein